MHRGGHASIINELQNTLQTTAGFITTNNLQASQVCAFPHYIRAEVHLLDFDAHKRTFRVMQGQLANTARTRQRINECQQSKDEAAKEMLKQ